MIYGLFRLCNIFPTIFLNSVEYFVLLNYYYQIKYIT
jgi:hypothetical protein